MYSILALPFLIMNNLCASIFLVHVCWGSVCIFPVLAFAPLASIASYFHSLHILHVCWNVRCSNPITFCFMFFHVSFSKKLVGELFCQVMRRSRKNDVAEFEHMSEVLKDRRRTASSSDLESFVFYFSILCSWRAINFFFSGSIAFIFFPELSSLTFFFDSWLDIAVLLGWDRLHFLLSSIYLLIVDLHSDVVTVWYFCSFSSFVPPSLWSFLRSVWFDILF